MAVTEVLPNPYISYLQSIHAQGAFRDAQELDPRTSGRKKVFFLCRLWLVLWTSKCFTSLCLTLYFLQLLTAGLPQFFWSFLQSMSSLYLNPPLPFAVVVHGMYCAVSISSPPWRCPYPVASCFPRLSDKFQNYRK